MLYTLLHLSHCLSIMKFRDLTGQRFDRLVAIRRVENLPGYGQARWLFHCDCGREVVAFGYNICHGRQKSCGCYFTDNPARLTHGQTGSRAYHTWCGMRARCEQPTAQAYKDYGGRGIKVCDQWQSFEQFFADMGDPPDGYSLEREDNDGPYSPENCRWASRADQVRNRRITLRYTHLGETRSLADWADHFGLPYKVVWHRYTHAEKRGDELFAPLRVISRRSQGKADAPSRAAG